MRRVIASWALATTVGACSSDPATPSAAIIPEGTTAASATASAAPVESVAAPTLSASAAPLVDLPPPVGKAMELAPDAIPVAHRASLLATSKAFAASGTHEVHGNDFDIVLNPGAAASLAKFKDATMQVGADSIEALGDRAFSAPDWDLSATFEKVLEDAGVAGQDWTTGRVSVAKIARVPSHDRMFAIDFTLAADVGSDDTTGLLEVDDAGHAKVVMMIRNDGYKSVSEARMASSWAISPPDADGHWFVIDAFSHPWISSAWRGITYRVLEKGPTAATPKVIHRASDSAYLGGESIASVEADTSSFEVDYASWENLAGNVTRAYVRRFALENGKPHRIAPWVSSPIDFVDEWLNAESATVADAMVQHGARAEAAKLWGRVHDPSFQGFGALTLDGKSGLVDLETLPDHVTVDFAPPAGGEVKRAGAPIPFPTHLSFEIQRTKPDGWVIQGVRATW